MQRNPCLLPIANSNTSEVLGALATKDLLVGARLVMIPGGGGVGGSIVQQLAVRSCHFKAIGMGMHLQRYLGTYVVMKPGPLLLHLPTYVLK